MTSSDDTLPLMIDGLRASVEGEYDVVALFSLQCLSTLLLKTSGIYGHTPDPVFVKVVPYDRLRLTDTDYQNCADMLRPYGVGVAKVLWRASPHEQTYLYHYVYLGDIEAIMRYEYYRDHTDTYDPHLEKVYT